LKFTDIFERGTVLSYVFLYFKNREDVSEKEKWQSSIPIKKSNSSSPIISQRLPKALEAAHKRHP
jgi:hypothetical protein